MMKLKLICLLVFILYFPSLFNHFSHDDYFNLQLARANSVTDVVRFFDPIHAPERVGSYRPLSTQIYFLISWFFDKSSYPLHLIAFGVFFADIYLVYKLAKIVLVSEKSSLVAAFLYAVSATHFAHLYWPSIFQELALIFFFLFSVISFLQKRYIFSFVMMIGGLLSKETAIMIPAVLTLFVLNRGEWKNLWKLIPFYLFVGVFLFVHLVFFGLPPGSVYKMDFSLRVFNTLMWYVLWAFNLPELLVDYIGPGLHVNFNLIRFYGSQIVIILLFFCATLGSLIYVLSKQKINWPLILVCSGWFLLTLLPVIFLPWHKFTYELGVPLAGLVVFLGFLTENLKPKMIFLLCSFWLATSFFTLQLSVKTHWVTQGGLVAQRVEKYFQTNEITGGNVVFYDTSEDVILPWSPAGEVKINLSDQDFFTVYYPGKYLVEYRSEYPRYFDARITYIPARQFLGY